MCARLVQNSSHKGCQSQSANAKARHCVQTAAVRARLRASNNVIIWIWMMSPAREQPDCCASPVSRSFFIPLVMVISRNLDLIYFFDKKNLLKLSAEVLFPGGSNLIPLSACTSHFELLVFYILF